MALEESPAFQFYPKDWLTSERTRVMGAEARGYYMDLLSYAWLKKGLPTALRDLAVLLSVPRSKMQRLWVVLGPSWVEHQGRLINTRQEEEREKQNLYRQRQKDAANKRWESRGIPDAVATDIPLESLPSLRLRLRLLFPVPADGVSARSSAASGSWCSTGCSRISFRFLAPMRMGLRSTSGFCNLIRQRFGPTW